jgi:hypothetical protein
MPPSKREILDKYQDVISNADFELLVADDLPSPETAHQEGFTLQLLGKLNGWWVFAKRYGWAVVGVIIFSGDFISGVESINKYSRIAYNEVAGYVSKGQNHCDVPATEYVVADRPPQWALQSEEPFRLVNAPASTTTTSTTTTTTTTAAPEDTFGILSSGSGLVPYSSGWEGLA